MRCRLDDLAIDAFSQSQKLTVRITSGDARPFFDAYGLDRELEISLSVPKMKRSKDANAYFWELLGQLSVKLRIPRMELYRHYIREIGQSEMMSMPIKAIEPFRRAWEKDHEGRFVEVIEKDERMNHAYLQVFYGSSDFDTGTFSMLIDMVIEDCKENGIETATPSEREQLMKEWARRYARA